jgi:hypothetical protein
MLFVWLGLSNVDGMLFECSVLSNERGCVGIRHWTAQCALSFEVASYLDPRFKASFLTRDGREKIESLLPTAHTTEASTDVEPRNKRPRFFTLLNETPRASTATDNMNKHPEVALYESEDLLTETSCPLQYWLANSCRLPTMAKLALVYLSIPASSAPVERLFSVAGKVFRADRCRLKDSTFHDIMLVRAESRLH